MDETECVTVWLYLLFHFTLLLLLIKEIKIRLCFIDGCQGWRSEASPLFKSCSREHCGWWHDWCCCATCPEVEHAANTGILAVSTLLSKDEVVTFRCFDFNFFYVKSVSPIPIVFSIYSRRENWGLNGIPLCYLTSIVKELNETQKHRLRFVKIILSYPPLDFEGRVHARRQ